jgi:hypothetical protein
MQRFYEYLSEGHGCDFTQFKSPGRTLVLLWRYVRLNEHLAKLFQLLRATDFLREQRKLDNMEEFVVKFVGFVQILLLHLVANVTMFAVGR